MPTNKTLLYKNPDSLLEKDSIFSLGFKDLKRISIVKKLNTNNTKKSAKNHPPISDSAKE